MLYSQPVSMVSAVLKNLTAEQCTDAEFMRSLEQRYDNIRSKDPAQSWYLGVGAP